MQDNPYGFSSFPQQVAVPEPKHSGVGITSFVLSLLSGFGMVVLCGVAVYMAMKAPGGMADDDPMVILLGLAVIGLGMTQVFAFILGAVALFQPNRKRIFAVLGTIFSLLAMLSVVGLIILGSL
jgi:membrane-associated HD superfamily phosphohydrolase